MLDNDELKFSNAVTSVSIEPVLVFKLPIWANWDPVAANKLVWCACNKSTLFSSVVTLAAIEELKAVDEPDIIASVTSIVIWSSLTVVVIGPPPANVRVSPELNESSVPESAAKVNEVLIPAISLAILALVDVNAPEIAVLLAAEPVKAYKFVWCACNKSTLFSSVVTLPAIEELNAVEDPDILAAIWAEPDTTSSPVANNIFTSEPVGPATQ